ncbi:MAG: translation initiation factor IF-2 [Ardenticatenaceae bacterium]|nr:translation initiation factor IF-2 [Anaerolineales bacterium]MCB8922649.1 translation initiation factor IF-2 [Ardenticatenaceae bacterium]MCB9003643.1 translation initiation factor IF-2 [Ardenticatenaceae bacterium]
MAQTKTIIELPDFVTVRELATIMDRSPIDVIKELMGNGIMANINQQIDFDTAAIVAEEMGFEAIQFSAVQEEEEEVVEEKLAWRKILAEEDESKLQSRPPVITMLGHVDHGKTSLLDVIRQANVQAGEAGGITQHIGAYQIVHEGQPITFLDTPGHEAFTAMRARGAQATDIAILVVAADDGVMPQTREAADHARAAHVPIIVALNKIDLPSANPPRVMQQLSEIGLVPDEWDGDTMVIPVSAKERLGMEDLLEAILLVTEDLNPRANPNASPTGVVLEAQKEKGRGVVATLLVQNGTLKHGDTLLVDHHYGRIKAMFDFTGKTIKKAGPSTPVAVSGLNGTPEAGDQFTVVASEKEARRIVSEIETVAGPERQRPTTLDEFFARLQQGDTKTLYLIVKADVQGSLEPIVNSLEKLSNDEVSVEILRSDTGSVTESDVMLASASDAVILGFNVGADPIAYAAASSEQVEIKSYNIIYHLIEDVEKALKGMLEPTYEQVVIGRAEVRQTFKIRSLGRIAGCFMRTGEARRNGQGRVIRNKKLMYSGSISSLKHLQDNVREVKAGFEFGVRIGDFDDYQAGDIIEFFVTQKVEVA